MASNDTQLQIVISALDNASATLKQIANNTAQAGEQVTASSESSSLSFGKLVESIGLAEIAVEALRETWGEVKGFFEESINAAVDASATMAQVKVDVANAGLAYSQIGPQIDAVAQKNEMLGFSQEDTQLSMGKLLLATGDYSQALKLNQLAMDLSRAKGIDLNDATVLIQQVMAGNTRALKQYGISLDSATTSGEALNMLQQKLQGSSQAFADTSAGDMAIMKAQWEEMQVQVGEAFMPILKEVFTQFEEHLPEIISFLKGMADMLGKDFDNIVYIGNSTGIFEAIKLVVEGLVGDFMLLSKGIELIADGIRDLRGETLNYTREGSALSSTIQMNADDFKKLNLTTSPTAANFDDIANHIQAADNAMVKHSDAVSQLTTEYDKMQQSGANDLASLADAFATKMDSINKTITDTQAKITDLIDSYSETQKTDTEKVAEAIVASSQKIADLKTQLSQATTANEQENLQKQLDAEQASYTSSQAWQQAHQDAMTAATARASETDLQRTIDDYNTKQAKDAETLAKQIKNLNDQYTAAQKEAADETKTYNDKVTQINGILDAAQLYFNKLSAERVATTTAEVKAEIAQFQALAAAISQTKSASASGIAGITIPYLPTTKVNDAVITPGGQVIQTDPADYLFATKNPGSLANNASGHSSTTVVVNINGGNYLDAQGANMIARAFAKEVGRQLKVSNFN